MIKFALGCAILLAACAPAARESAPAEPLRKPTPVTAAPPVMAPDTPISSDQPAILPPTPAVREKHPEGADCPISNTGRWAAFIDAMPGPGATPRLIVTGEIGVKPAYGTTLRLDPIVLESNPPQRTVILDVTQPVEPTIDMLTRREVRGEWPVSTPIGAVHIRCGRKLVTTIADVEVAH